MKPLPMVLVALVLVGAGAAGLGRCTGRAKGPPKPLGAEEKARFGALLRDGERLMEEGNLTTSREAFLKALAIDPGNPEALRLLASNWREALNFEKAREILKEAIQANPEDLDLLQERGRILEKTGHYEAAREDFQKVVEGNPKDPEAHFWLASVEFTLNRFEPALKAGRQALALGLEDPQGRFIVGAASESLGDDETAEKEYRRALEGRPGLLEARYRLGHLMVRMGRREEGQAELKRGSRIAAAIGEIERLEAEIKAHDDAGSDDLMKMAEDLGTAYLEAFLFSETEAHIREATKYRPLTEGITVILGIALVGLARETEALEVLREGRTLFPASTRIKETLTRLEEWRRLPPAERPTPVELAEALSHGGSG